MSKLNHGPCGHLEGPYHDCMYVERRNALIPRAEAHATREKGDRTNAGLAWTEAFVAAMDRLAAEAGIASGQSYRPPEPPKWTPY